MIVLETRNRHLGTMSRDCAQPPSSSQIFLHRRKILAKGREVDIKMGGIELQSHEKQFDSSVSVLSTCRMCAVVVKNKQS